MSDFTSVPIIDFQRLQDPETKAETLAKLRDAIFLVGFLYLTNHGLESLTKRAHAALPDLFSLPSETKEQINMINSPSFLGYTRLGAETTALKTDMREQFDFGTPNLPPYSSNPTTPVWSRLEGQNQYPTPATQSLVEEYITSFIPLSNTFLQYVAESLSLPPTTFDTYRGAMDRLKFIKYPPQPSSSSGEEKSQGVGPHKDSTGLFTFLSQDTTGGLQVLNKRGDWIDVPPLEDEGALVVNIQQGFEAITGGVCSATVHRVVAPKNTTRYSIPFFMGIRMDLTLSNLRESARHIVEKVPVGKWSDEDEMKRRVEDVPSEFLSEKFACFGEAYLRNRIISHPDVGKKWYPELYERYSNDPFYLH
ncbi:probable 2-oxoglutarate-dependent dioxygenase At3g49630 [Aspergillus awamori]|uniref:Probable 2-oxoglutarate-dependent dioxygenase At3g49630 n=1 Tax=Aspergillus awamori TaxID=105351 RepID=A0A401KZ11_ASPAW|nr:probable 2-oxoglutarate-dependent dioxygenase At3g49630 [Aspergillus awamori]